MARAFIVTHSMMPSSTSLGSICGSFFSSAVDLRSSRRSVQTGSQVKYSGERFMSMKLGFIAGTACSAIASSVQPSELCTERTGRLA